jgi:subtilisin
MLVVTVVTACLLVLSGTASAQRNSGNVVPGRFICVVDDFEDALAIGQAAARAHGGTLGHVYNHALNGFSIHVPPGIGVANLRAHRGVIHVEPDLVMHTCALVPTGVNRIDAEGVLHAGIDCSHVGIAIIDTGIQRNHPDLNVQGGTHFYGGVEDVMYDDDNGHGTHCAGIAAANGAIVGVAPGAKLYAVKVLDRTGSGYLSDIIAGINWVTAHAVVDGIHAANMSLGGQGQSPALYTAMSNCPVYFAVAAGNSRADIYGPDGLPGTPDDFIPAAYGDNPVNDFGLENVFTISAMVDTDGQPGGKGPSTSYGKDDSFASFSNYSRAGAIAYIEPGVNIYSTYLNSGYATMSGTSMASPHAAGLLALAELAGIPPENIASWSQNSPSGLRQPSGDPDGQYEPLGNAGQHVDLKLHIGNLASTAKKVNTRYWQATVTITVDDQSLATVFHTTVTGTWSNGGRGNSTATTGTNGMCTVSLNNLTSSSVTFTVTGVTAAGYTYDPSSNNLKSAVIVVKRP